MGNKLGLRGEKEKMFIKLSKKQLKEIRFAIMNELIRQESNQDEYYRSLKSSLGIITRKVDKNDRTFRFK